MVTYHDSNNNSSNISNTNSSNNNNRNKNKNVSRRTTKETPALSASSFSDAACAAFLATSSRSFLH